MKGFKLIISNLFLLLLLLSCKNVTANQIKIEEEKTIKSIVQSKEVEIAWTKEIEEEILGTPLAVPSKYKSANVLVTPDMLKLSRDTNQAVYPELNNFGSLDTSELSPYIRQKIDKFATALNENIYSGPEKYFFNQYKFNYLFFRNDFIQGWTDYFKKDFPYTAEERKTADGEESEKINLFTKYVVGQPFLGAEIISLPVRFYCQEGNIDVTLYISNDNQSLIYQITIDRWVKV